MGMKKQLNNNILINEEHIHLFKFMNGVLICDCGDIVEHGTITTIESNVIMVELKTAKPLQLTMERAILNIFSDALTQFGEEYKLNIASCKIIGHEKSQKTLRVVLK